MGFWFIAIVQVFLIVQIKCENGTETTTLEVETTTSSCVHGYLDENDSCKCNAHYEGEQCEQIICENGYTTGPDDSHCHCFYDYYGTYCQYKCVHGIWLYANVVDRGFCQCVSGWTGASCDIPHSHSQNYQTYAVSILFLCLAAFILIACLCYVNKRREGTVQSYANGEDAESPIRRFDRRQYGSFYEGDANPSAGPYEAPFRPPPPPLPKYEDALKLPVYVAPSQNTNDERSDAESQPPPSYADISTITDRVDRPPCQSPVDNRNHSTM